jgi:hypothetical protein
MSCWHDDLQTNARLTITNCATQNGEINVMKGDTLYLGIVIVFILLVIGILMYAFGSFQRLWGDLDLIGVAGFIVLYIILGQDQAFQPKRVGIEPPKTTH